MKTRSAYAEGIAHAVGGGRFRMLRMLTERSGVRTYLARDTRSGSHVVVKVSQIPTGDGALLEARLDHEAAVLRSIESAYVAPLLDHGREGDNFYVVTPLIEGLSLERRLRLGPLSARDAVTLAISLMRALHDAHDMGVVHRDVKPSNIIVDAKTPLEHATLIDFGLARSDDLDPSVRDVPAGTALYMAPEQAGLLDGGVDERSDLYAAGAVLFECLTGRPPFEGKTLGEVLRQHLSSKPPELRELGIDVPRAVDELLQRLLAKEPRARYQSTSGVLADLEEIAAALDRGESEPAVVIGARDRRRSLAEPAFVGRDYELSALEAELERARRGTGGVVLIEAESGGGKTRLVQEFAQRATLSGSRVFRGQGTNQAAQRPYEILRGVAHSLLERAHSEPELRVYVRDRLSTDRDAICAALPELCEFLEAEAEHAGGPEEFGEARSLDALEALLTALGSPDHPAVLILDDCQWADELTLKLLARFNGDRSRSKRYVLIAVAFRSEEVGPGHTFRSFDDPIRLTLDPLRSADVRSLVESMAGPVPDEAVEVVVGLAEGSPFMAAAVLRGLVESGALVEGTASWETVPDALAEASASRRAGALLARRLELVDGRALHLLRAGAVLGKEFDVNLAALLADATPDELIASLDDAKKRHLIWLRGSVASFVHDKIRETILDGLSVEDRSELHAEAADRIQALDIDRVFEIAYHLDAAGDGGRALPFAIQAAERARQRHALAISQQNYEIAERAATAVGRSTRLRIIEGLGDVLMLRGCYDEASSRFELAASLTSDALSDARIAGKIGELAFKKGDVRTGARALERALRVLGYRTPRTFIGALLRVPWVALVQALHTIAPRFFCGRRSVADGEADLLAVRHFDRLAYSYWFYRGPVPALWAHLRGLNVAQRYSTSPELAKSVSTHVAALSLIVPFMPKRALRYAERAVALARETGDMWGEGNAFHFWGIANYTTGRFRQCVEKTREAIKLFERTGDRWEANIASYHLASSLEYLGERMSALDVARGVHRSGVEIGDPQARGFALSAWSRATGGDVPRDLVRAERERETEDVLTSAEVELAEAIRLIGAGDPINAEGVLQAAISRVLRAQMLQVYVASLFAWRVTALRLQAENASIYGSAQLKEIHARWRRASRRARLIAVFYVNERAQTWREAALLAAAQGRVGRARKLFARSLRASERAGQEYERAQTLIARARVGVALAWPEADVDLASAEDALGAAEGRAPSEVAVTVSLLDRFDSVLIEGRRIASALSKEAVYEAVQEAATTLLRPERAVVLELRQDGSDEPVAVAGSAGEFSSTIARRAISEGRPVVVSEDEAADVSESMILSGVRSSLAAPVYVRGRASACFYIEHRGIARLFGPDEERIAEFIAAVAGAALENAEGFAEIRDLTRTLERRVAERTVELGTTNVRLEQTLADLKRLDQLKTEFMAMAAHDLRTPLTVIAGFAATLRESWDVFSDDDRKKFLYRINANTKRLSEFVENLLHFARIESGELSYDIRPFDISALVLRTADEQSAAEGISRFCVRIADGLPCALGDEQRIWQVLTNLFSNALKFSPPDAPVEVEVWGWDASLAVTVRDHGPGISDEDQEKLFQKFSRIERSDGQKGPLGTGLGLYICKSIIEAQDGRMMMTGSPGAGSAFTFTLPAAERAATMSER